MVQESPIVAGLTIISAGLFAGTGAWRKNSLPVAELQSSRN